MPTLTSFRMRHIDVIGVGAAVLVLSAVAYVRVPLLPYIGRDLSMSAADLGLFTTVFALGRLATDIPAGRLSDLRSASSLLAAAAALLGVTSLAVAVSTIGWAVLTAAFFLGVSSALVNTTGMVYFAEQATADRRGRSMAGFSAALLGGQALGPALGGALGSAWDWRVGLAAGGILAMLVGAAVAVGRCWANDSRSETHRESGCVEQVPLTERIILHFVPFAVFFSFGAMPQTLVPIIGVEEFGLSAALVGTVLGVGGLCRFVGAMVGGAVSDRISRKAALVPALVAQAAGVALLAWEGSLWAWTSAVIVMSVASFSVSVAATMLVDHGRGRCSGRRLGPFRFFGDIGLIAGPFTASLVYQHLGQRSAALLVVMVLLSSGLASAVGLRETRSDSGATDLGAQA